MQSGREHGLLRLRRLNTPHSGAASGSLATEAIHQQVRACPVVIRKRKKNEGIGICREELLRVDGSPFVVGEFVPHDSVPWVRA